MGSSNEPRVSPLSTLMDVNYFALTFGVAGGLDLAKRINARSGPLFAQVLIGADEPARALPPRDGQFVKNRFRAALGLAPF